MPSRDTQITGRVSEEEKRQFNDYVELSDTPQKSLSDLLRTSAYREMSGSLVKTEVEDALDSTHIGVESVHIINAVENYADDIQRILENGIVLFKTDRYEQATQPVG